MSDSYFETACILKYETDKAILVNDGTNEFWLPKSRISFEKNNDGIPGSITVKVPEWLLRKKGVFAP